MVRILGQKIKVFGRDPYREVLRGVTALRGRYDTMDATSRAFFWEFYGPTRLETWLDDVAGFSIGDKHERAGHAKLVAEAKAVTKAMSMRQEPPNRIDEQNTIRCVVFSNVISYDVQVGTDGFEDIWRAYHGTVYDFGVKPLHWEDRAS